MGTRPALVFILLLVMSVSSDVLAQANSDPGRRSGRGDSRRSAREKQSFECADGYTLEYTLAAPRQPAEGKRYPLVLCLHGAGGSTAAPQALARRPAMECFVLAPSVSTKEFSWAGKRRKGLPYVFEAIDALLREHPIDPDRIYVTGQSMGGQGTWGALAARPGFFAAAAPVCGGWDPADAARFKDVPIWVFHGADDPVVPVTHSRSMVEALRAAGGEPRYTEYPGVKHNSWASAYGTDELWEWMFTRRRGAEPEADGTDAEDAEDDDAGKPRTDEPAAGN